MRLDATHTKLAIGLAIAALVAILVVVLNTQAAVPTLSEYYVGDFTYWDHTLNVHTSDRRVIRVAQQGKAVSYTFEGIKGVDGVKKAASSDTNVGMVYMAGREWKARLRNSKLPDSAELWCVRDGGRVIESIFQTSTHTWSGTFVAMHQ